MKGRASSSSSFNYQWAYDVFINFRGKDARHGFAGSLYNALCQKGIRTFFDDEELRKGDEITPTLLQAIEQSRMAIIVFSKNYASSKFCLDELVKILQCIKGKGRLVWPIFYDVEPSDVRYQKGNYEEALAMHQTRFNASKVQKWKGALQEAANISGLYFNLWHEYEYQFIQRIVEEISGKINRIPLHIAKYPVGLETRVLEINSLLGVVANDEVRMVGICGIGGIGKTTIARAVYNSIADQFEDLCFLHDIREESREHGLVKVQERMLLEILGENIKVGYVNKGIPIIERRFNQKKILLILDNVDEQQQLENLAGHHNWFGSGSRIIITTRDKHLLARHGVKSMYEVKEFSDEESLELLRQSAFGNNQVDQSYMKVMNCAVQYAHGLPLSLELIGSHLFGKNIKEWKSALDTYKRVPDKIVQQILKISYDGLGEVEQNIFLDIACFYKGKKLEYVKDIVEHVHGSDQSYSIGVLIDKCLIKIENNHIQMHDLIEDMGREIVRQESIEEPGERSRLWSYEDIVHVLENNTGTNKIKIIFPKYLFEDVKVNWDGKAFENMKNLKMLIFEKACFLEGPKYLPNSLRVLQWRGYPASCLPVNFNPKNLDMLDLPNSCLQSLEQVKSLVNVSVLNLNRCPFITEIPDISGIPNLIQLRVGFCENLTEIHNSVGHLRELKILEAHWCKNLQTFPRCIKLPSLKVLGLTGCSSLKKFPEIQDKMEYITELDLSKTNLEELPFSVRNFIALRSLLAEKCEGFQLSSRIAMLPKLENISLAGCEELRLCKQDEGQEHVSTSVKEVNFVKCNISDEFLLICLFWFVNVKHLDLSGNDFTILPECIKECHFLELLYLSDCKNLREIRGIPPNIKELWATHCTSLSSESRNILTSQELHEARRKQVCLPGSTIPEWLDRRQKTPDFCFWFRDELPVITLCCVMSQHHLMLDDLWVIVAINSEGLTSQKASSVKVCAWEKPSRLLEDHILLFGVSQPEIGRNYNVSLEREWNHVEVLICVGGYTRDSGWLKEVGIHIMNQESRMVHFRCTSPHKKIKLTRNLNWGSSLIASTWTSDSASNKGVERLLQLMEDQNQNVVPDLGGRTMLVNELANIDWECRPYYSVLRKCVPLLDKWLQDIQKGMFGDEESDESVDEFLYASLCALKMLPVTRYDLQTCNLRKTVNLLLRHKYNRIRNEAKKVIDTLKLSDAKTGSSRICYDGNK